MAVPYTFGTATAAIPLSQLDSNFATAITIGNTAVQLGNTVTTLNNMTLANVTISSGTVTITNVAVTTANVSGTANISTLVVTANASVAGNVTVSGNTVVTGNVTSATHILTGGTTNGVVYLDATKALTTGSALVFDGTNFGLTFSQNAATKATLTNSNVGASASARYEASNGSNTAEFGIRGSAQTTNGVLAPQVGYVYSPSAAGLALVGGAGPILFSAGGTTESMRLDSSGNLGVGTTSPTTKLHVFGSGANARVENSGATNSTQFQVKNTVGTVTLGLDSSTGGGFGVANAAVVWYDAAYPLLFGTNNTERARIDSSGNLLVGATTNPYTTRVVVGFNGGSVLGMTFNDAYATAGNSTAIYFARNASVVGTIVTTLSATAYNTSSDYRLKNTIAPMTGALAKVALLKPCTYKWNADGSDGEGFIAHELAEVVPQCVTGEKDAVDADGNPKYQGIDTSFLVATLTAAIQELKAEFDAYKASHP
jgi:hypothetical protein